MIIAHYFPRQVFQPVRWGHFGIPEISGGEFLLNGVTTADSVVPLTDSDLLSGTLEDGSPFVFSRLTYDDLDAVTLVNVSLPALDTSHITVDSDNAPPGLRTGQSLTLKKGGILPDNFPAVNATLNITGGVAGKNLEAVGGQVMISGGAIGESFRALSDSQVTITGGSIGNAVDVNPGSKMNIFGGSIGEFLWAYDDSQVNLYGTHFNLNGTPLSDAPLGQRVTIAARNGSFWGRLTDGFPFYLFLSDDRTSAANYFSPDATLTVTLVSLLEGDYDSNGQVDQADLDLLLHNWGAEITDPAGVGWINDLPTGLVDQQELDRLLLNWGIAVPLGAASVPEPPSVAMPLAGAAICLLFASAKRSAKQKVPKKGLNNQPIV